jgi:hypothetical protein
MDLKTLREIGRINAIKVAEAPRRSRDALVKWHRVKIVDTVRALGGSMGDVGVALESFRLKNQSDEWSSRKDLRPKPFKPKKKRK